MEQQFKLLVFGTIVIFLAFTGGYYSGFGHGVDKQYSAIENIPVTFRNENNMIRTAILHVDYRLTDVGIYVDELNSTEPIGIVYGTKPREIISKPAKMG